MKKYAGNDTLSALAAVVKTALNEHRTDADAHSDIRDLVNKYRPKTFAVTIPATNAGANGTGSGSFPACTASETSCIVDAAPAVNAIDAFYNCGFQLRTISPTEFIYSVDRDLTEPITVYISVQEV